MKLPNRDRAIIDREKFVSYCLNPDHPRGKHKARVFENVLGITIAQTEELIESIFAAIHSQPCAIGHADEYGVRYVVDFISTKGSRSARVRTCWICLHADEIPRLTSCFIL